MTGRKKLAPALENRPNNDYLWDRCKTWGAANMRANLKLVKPSPTPVNGTVPPKRACNADVMSREYLTPKEVDRLIKAARARGRYGARDSGRADRSQGSPAHCAPTALGGSPRPWQAPGRTPCAPHVCQL